MELTLTEKKDVVARGLKDPVWFARVILGIDTLTWGGHIEILEAMAKENRVVVKSGHSMGKDFMSGLISLWFLYTHPNSVVLTTAPTERQVSKVIWGEISNMWKNAKFGLGGQLNATDLKISDKWYAMGFTTKDSANETSGKFQGFKGKSILVVVTEGQAVEDGIYEQIEGVMTSEISKMYVAGNPLRTEGAFYRMFQDPTFKRFTFSCYDSPNYKEGREVVPGMVTRAWVEDKETRWGKGSPIFQARVMGDFPQYSVSSLISMEQLRNSEGAVAVGGKKVLAVDVARYGEDETSFIMTRGGKMIGITSHQGKPTTETEGRIISLIRKHKVDVVVVDEGAMGAGIVDHLYEQQKELSLKIGRELEVVGFNFGGKASENFVNKGTEAYYKTCKAIEQGKVQLMFDEDLYNQLAARKYEFSSKGLMRLESKDKVKSRGMPSPDRADALVMALYYSMDDYEEAEETDYSHLEAKLNPYTGYVVKEA